MVNTLSIIFTLIGLVLGVGLGFILRKKKSKGLIEKAMQEANQIRNKAKSDAESMKKEKILQAKERFIELKSEHEKVILDREKKVVSVENRLREKENAVNNEMRKANEQSRKFEQKNKTLDQKIETFKRKAEALEAEHQIQTERLETISNLSAEEAKEALIDSLKEKANHTNVVFLGENTI